MSETNKGYMVKLDQWSDENVVWPLSLAYTNGNDQSRAAAIDAAKKAIREKVLESYRNGLKTTPQKAFAQRRPHGV